MTKEDKLEKFHQALDEIKNARYQFEVPMPTFEATVPQQTEIFKRLIYSEIFETEMILEEIYEWLELLSLIQKRIDVLMGKTAKVHPKDQKKMASLVEEMLESHRKIIVLIKVAYEWIYHLKELIEKRPEVRSLVPNEMWAELQAYCKFRNEVVAHKAEVKIHPMGTLRVKKGGESAELFMTPLAMPKSAVKELNSIFRECQERLLPEEAAEKNTYERCIILNRNLKKLSGNQIKKVEIFMRKFGAVSAEPIDIAIYLKELVKELLPKLAELK